MPMLGDIVRIPLQPNDQFVVEATSQSFSTIDYEDPNNREIKSWNVQLNVAGMKTTGIDLRQVILVDRDMKMLKNYVKQASGLSTMGRR